MIKLGTLFWLVLVAAMGFAMFAVKYEVQALEDELARTKKATIAEQHEIRVLDAEWAYLTRPETLEDLNRRYLSLAPIATKQLHVTFTDIPLRPPAPAPVEAPDVVADGDVPSAEGGTADSPAQPVMPAPPLVLTSAGATVSLAATPPQVVSAPIEKPSVEKAAGEKPARAQEVAKPVPVKRVARPAAPGRPRSLDELIAQIVASR